MAAHDFASNKKSTKAKTTSSKKAPRGKPSSSSKNATGKPASTKANTPTSKKKVPAIIWIVLGVSIAFGGQHLYNYLKNNPKVSTALEKANESIAKTTQKAIEPVKEIQEKAPRFEFYELLKENQVEVTVEPTPTSERKKYQYIVQAGSFRSKEDAERMRSMLILNNLTNTSTDNISTKDGTWYRVNVGPFTNRSKLEKARDTLASMNIQSLVKKIPLKN